MLDNDHLIALGAVAERAAAVEKVVRVLASELLDSDERVGAVIFERTNFGQIASKIGALAALRPLTEGLQADIADAGKLAAAGMNQRNELLHSHWESESKETLQVRGKGATEPYSIEVTVEDIEDVGRTLAGLWRFLHMCWLRVVVELGRTEVDPNETRPGFTTVPNRWRVVDPPRPSLSRSKTVEQLWVEGRISSEEFEQTRRIEEEGSHSES